MTKPELINALSAKMGLSKAGAERFLEATIAEIVRSLVKKGKVRLAGLGTFKARLRRARMGVNPQTHEPMKIAAKKTVSFRPAPALRKVL